MLKIFETMICNFFQKNKHFFPNKNASEWTSKANICGGQLTILNSLDDEMNPALIKQKNWTVQNHLIIQINIFHIETLYMLKVLTEDGKL